MKQLEQVRSGVFFEDWYREFPPAKIIVHNVKTGEQIEEPSLVAARIQTTEPGKETVEERIMCWTAIKQYLAVGTAAREYEGAADTVVFSPFRDGQIAHYDSAVYLFQSLIKRMYTGLHFFKPTICVRAQERTTQVEERAIVDAGIQAGAKQVFLYKVPFSALLDDVPKCLRRAYIIHIEPQE